MQHNAHTNVNHGIGIGSIVFIVLLVIQILALSGVGNLQVFPGPWGGWLFVIGIPILVSLSLVILGIIFAIILIVILNKFN
jgi:hypothetical protein